ncbi:uncharacterized protein UV8b_08121 [Ustilaginoidea virens]|uniref:Uncharacterized protein n=1 Tax=Ustilaginoidea virens TaxID=1159556 RepID=A0A8E5HYT3_USTVR|nr:uncharacterized protein UV8b_08121 [Ustilaginoidea virens]QUC23880.1 hypothetical protein UV8b_08121 [Ustilaginoidea virens]
MPTSSLTRSPPSIGTERPAPTHMFPLLPWLSSSPSSPSFLLVRINQGIPTSTGFPLAPCSSSTCTTLISAMAPGGHWADAAFLHDLVVAFFEAGAETGAHTAEVRNAITSRMDEMHHKVTWEGIRQHIQKLRRDQTSPQKANNGAGSAGSPTKSATPRKRKAPSKTSKVAPEYYSDMDDELPFKAEDADDKMLAKRIKME